MAEPTGNEGLKLLYSTVQKLVANDGRFSDMEYRILTPPASGQTLTIEVSKGRCSRQVIVESLMLQPMALSGQPDAGLIRELRTALLHVLRLSQKRR
ncbi:MAG TPA: hypothetical protein VNN18_06655 [Candidatus Xenobia bacterium]|nr:hypothetical protein [Candidatus Xenobia bacterium]